MAIKHIKYLPILLVTPALHAATLDIIGFDNNTTSTGPGGFTVADQVLDGTDSIHSFTITGDLDGFGNGCLLYTSPSPRDKRQSRMPSSA